MASNSNRSAKSPTLLVDKKKSHNSTILTIPLKNPRLSAQISHMIQFETSVRIRYGETDRMGYAYYGNYASYFEVARVEMLRSLGITYKKLEDDGILLPVAEFAIKYYAPAYYDDILRIVTSIEELPAVRMKFRYKTYREEKLLNEASTDLVFVDARSGKPIRCPADVLNLLQPQF